MNEFARDVFLLREQLNAIVLISAIGLDFVDPFDIRSICGGVSKGFRVAVGSGWCLSAWCRGLIDRNGFGPTGRRRSASGWTAATASSPAAASSTCARSAEAGSDR